MADYIPFKIQAEIMKRLPVISLIRFRTVSKQWKSLIDSPNFIAEHCVIQHHTQSEHHGHLLLSYMEPGSPSVVRYFSIVDDDTFPRQKVFMATPVSVNPLIYHSPAELVGVSGGLFCIYGPNRNIMNAVIWNPSIKKTVTIVVPNVPDDDDLPYDTILGFGVCPRTSDPKLVKITFNDMYQTENPTIPNQVEVFSLTSGLWKPPSSKLLPRKSVSYTYPQVAINEFIYWLAYDMSSFDSTYQYPHLIMSFDLKTEQFAEVYLPQSLASSTTHVCISKLNESLVVLEKNHSSNANVWIMNGLNGDPQSYSYTHIFTINMPITWIRDVAGFRKNGAPLILKKKGLKENELIVYEPNSKQINYTGIAGAFSHFFASPYTQTLLLLDHKDSVKSETGIGIAKQGTRSGHFRRVGRMVKGVTSSSSATSSSTSNYGASKRYSQEEVNELVKKKCKRISASFNKKLINLMTQLAEKGITLDKTPVVGEEDEEYEKSDEEAMEDVDDGMEDDFEAMDDEDDY